MYVLMYIGIFNMKIVSLSALCFLILVSLVAQVISQDLIIQENETGFCFMDGMIESDVSDFTGIGYVNVDPGIGTSMSWNVQANSAGKYHLR